MKVSDALRGAARLFLDTAPVIYYVERHPKYASVVDEVFNRIDAGTLPAVTSPVTLSEALVVPVRLGQAAVQRDFTDLIVNGVGITFRPLEEVAARRAADLRARYNLSLADAFQVAAALEGACDTFLTNDHALQRIRELPVLVVDQLEP